METPRRIAVFVLAFAYRPRKALLKNSAFLVDHFVGGGFQPSGTKKNFRWRPGGGAIYSAPSLMARWTA